VVVNGFIGKDYQSLINESEANLSGSIMCPSINSNFLWIEFAFHKKYLKKNLRWPKPAR